MIGCDNEKCPYEWVSGLHGYTDFSSTSSASTSTGRSQRRGTAPIASRRSGSRRATAPRPPRTARGGKSRPSCSINQFSSMYSRMCVLRPLSVALHLALHPAAAEAAEVGAGDLDSDAQSCRQ
jgi:hypothetical protein